MIQLADHFTILRIDASASTAELKAAYRREISQWHPDRFYSDPTGRPAATERAKQINAAYRNLSDLHELGSLPRSTPRTNGRRTAPQPRPQKASRTEKTYEDKKSFTPGFPDLNVLEVFVRSSHITSAGYNPETKTLYIRYHGDAVYSYLDVLEEVFTELMIAESPGKFVHRFICSRYQSVRH